MKGYNCKGYVDPFNGIVILYNRCGEYRYFMAEVGLNHATV
jgi:hypothetical protein